MAEYLAPDEGATKQGDASKRTDEASDDKADRQLETVKLATKWAQELAASKKWMQKFTERARRCERAYIDEGDGGASVGRTDSGNVSRVNLFWSNVEVTLAAIYARLPKASVDRRFRDEGDDVSRVAATMLERILNADIEREYDDTNASMRDAVQDRFVVGMGQCWCRYDVEIEDYEAPQLDPMTQQPTGATQPAQRIVDEQAATEYVYWEDFRYAPCRRWRECRWVARAVMMKEDRLRKRFSLTDAQLAMVPMTTRSAQGGALQDDVLKATPFKQARVWEIWDRESMRVIWYAEGCSYALDVQDDILGLDDFFPCPMPIAATTLTRAFLPKPDYVMAQDLYEELDEINTRLAALERACKAVGVRDKNAKGLERMLQEGCENEMIAVENWSAFSEKGGLKGSTDWMPIDQFVNAITQLTQRKQQVQRDLYELLGISDIMRGSSVASETATAQQLKVAYGGARLAKLQADVARFVSDIMRIRGDIVTKHFQPETIKRRSLVEKTPDAPYADQAVQLLKTEGLAEHAIRVDSDQLAAPDWEQEKKTRSEFMGAISNYVMAAAPLVAQAPSLGVFLMKLLQWGTAGFKGASSIESTIDQAVAQLEAQAAQPPAPPPPTPEDQKNLAAAEKNKAEADRAGADATGKKLENAATARVLGIPMGAPGGMPPGGPPGGMPPQATPGPRPGMPMPQAGPQAGPGGPPGMGLPPNPMPRPPMQ